MSTYSLNRHRRFSLNQSSINQTPDPIVTMWVNRVTATGGPTPSTNTQQALTTFIQTLESNNLLSSMYAVNCFVPDSLSASICPLITTVGNNVWTNTNFTSSDISVNGLKGDASSRYLNTEINAFPLFQKIRSPGMTMYAYTTCSSGQYDNGYTNNAGTIQFALDSNNTNNNKNATFTCWGIDAQDSASFLPSAGTTGFYLSGNRLFSNDCRLYIANSQISHSQVSQNVGSMSAAPTNQPIYTHAAWGYQLSTAFGYSNVCMSFFAVHVGLTPAQSSILFTAVQ